MSTMKMTFPGRSLFVLAYILLTIGFLTIHFTRVESFSTVVGGIVVKGRSSVGTALSPPQIRRIRISAGGLELNFRKADRAVLVTNDGIRHTLGIDGWERDDESVRILFSDGAAVRISTETPDTDILVTPEIPDTEPPVYSLELPLRPAGGVRVTTDPKQTGILNVMTPDVEYLVSLPRESAWNAGNQRLNLVVLDKADPVLRISDDRRGGGLSAQEWIDQGSAPTQAVYESRISGWIGSARNGWKLRVDARSGLWTDENGRTGWNDQRAAAVLADAVATDQLPSQIQSVTAVGDRAPGSIGWLPSPYLGNIINQSRSHRQKMAETANSLRTAMNSGKPAVGIESALTALIDSGFSADAVRLSELAREIPADDAGNSEILGRLQVLQEAVRLAMEESATDSTRRRELIENRLIPRIFWVKDGLWLIEEDGAVDLYLSVTAGVLLMREAVWSNDSVFQAVGRQLVLSALSYADDSGIIPGRLLFEASGDVVREGKIAPEALYDKIIDPPAYPRHVSLSKELGNGAWAVTGAEKFSLRSTPRETTITMDFPANGIHHLAITGVKKFNVLFMNGIRWNGDPNFQRYYAGWFYDESSETLYIKIRHRVETETIRILYYDPESPPAAG